MVAVWTQGTKFYREDAAQADTYNKIGGFTDLQPFSATVEQRDVTTLEDTVRQYARGLADYGEISGDLLFDPGDAAHDDAEGLMSLLADGENTFKFAIGFNTSAGDHMYGEGVLTGFQLQAGGNDSLKASITIKLSGRPTWNTTVPTAPS